jgi:hypothetical protein
MYTLYKSYAGKRRNIYKDHTDSIKHNGILRTFGYIIKAVCYNVSFCVSLSNVQWAELNLTKFSQVSRNADMQRMATVNVTSKSVTAVVKSAKRD